MSELNGIGPPSAERELPREGVVVFVDLDSERVLLDRTGSGAQRLAGMAWVRGPHHRSTVTASGQRSWFCMAELTHEGAYRVLRVSPGDLVNRVVPLDAVLGTDARVLVARLHDAHDTVSRLQLFTKFLVARAVLPSRWDPAVSHVLHRMSAAPGALEVATLAAQVGWSRKHLHRRLIQFTGLGPGRLLQIERFRAALITLHHGGASNLADLAQTLAYSDQSHFSREFRELADITPTEYLRTRAFNLDWGYARVERS